MNHFDVYLHPGIDEHTEAQQSYLNGLSLFKDKIVIKPNQSLIKMLSTLHLRLFNNLHLGAGCLRQCNMSKGSSLFCNYQFIPNELNRLDRALKTIDKPQQLFAIYNEVNVIHPFREGNGRTTMLWLDLVLIEKFNVMVDWNQIAKNDYLNAIQQGFILNIEPLQQLLTNALIPFNGDYMSLATTWDQSYRYEGIEPNDFKQQMKP